MIQISTVEEADVEYVSDDPNDRWVAAFYRGTQRLIEGGMNDHAAAVTALRRLHETLQFSGPEYAGSLEKHGLGYVAEAAEYRAGFRERLRHHWGDALDLYEVIASTIQHAATIFAKRNIGQSGGARYLLLDTLFQMNGRAIRVAREIHTLLAAGFPLGALSLARTIHEISVRASVLSRFGVDEEYEDLPEKLLLHDEVINYKDALIYQLDAGRLGYESFDVCRGRADARAARRTDCPVWQVVPLSVGWASNRPGLPAEPNFEQLEEAAALDHHRGLYKWSSHLIHGDPKALRLSKIERAGAQDHSAATPPSPPREPRQHSRGYEHRPTPTGTGLRWMPKTSA